MAALEEPGTIDGAKLEAFVFRAVDEIGATLNAALVVMGDKLGLYRALAGAGPLTSDERSFKTPALTPGQQDYYTLRMEVEKDGQVVAENRRVFIAAGQQVDVDFNAPATVTAQR